MVNNMKLEWITYRVNNLNNALDFYENILGLELNARFKVSETMELAFLKLDNTQIELIEDKERIESFNANEVSIGLEIKNTDEWLKYLSEKDIEVIGSMKQGANLVFTFIKDYDGNAIQLVEHV